MRTAFRASMAAVAITTTVAAGATSSDPLQPVKIMREIQAAVDSSRKRRGLAAAAGGKK